MTETFTFIVKFPVGSTVYFGDSDKAYVPQYYPHLIEDKVEAYRLDERGVIWYLFGRSSHTRPESRVFSTPQEVVDWYIEDLRKQFHKMEERTKEMLTYPPRKGEYTK